MLRIICLNFILAFIFLPSMNECWELKVQPEILDIGDRNVQLHCFYSRRQRQSSITQIIRLRLRKLSDNGKWTDFAAIRGDGSITSSSEANATVTGKLGLTNPVNSFLNVTWAEVNEEIFGKFLCDAVGYTQTQELETEHSETLEVNVKGLSADSLRLYELIQESQRNERLILRNVIAQLWSDVSSKLNELDSSFSNLTENNERLWSDVSSKLNEHDSRFSNLTESNERLWSDVSSKLNEHDSRLSNLTDSSAAETCTVREIKSIMSWPEGNFTLLMPDTGCPLDPPGWDKGYVKMNEGNATKYDPIIKPQHLAEPYRIGGYVYQHYCAIGSSFESERTTKWPPGSYCIQSASRSYNSCLGGFHFTELVVDYKDDAANRGYGAVPSPHVYNDYMWVYFCCRHDASPNTAIDLPVSKPFYLYRHGGTCQQVKGMHVTQDIFVVDTVRDRGGDYWDSFYPAANRPDVSINPIKEELCYYTKMAD